MQRSLILLLLIMLLSACVSTPKRVEPTPEQAPTPTPTAPTQANKCLDCGMVLDIRSTIATNQTTMPKKPILSGIVGGVVSKPSTAKPSSHYEILIQLLNGKKIVVTQALLSAGLRIGSKVRVSQGRILAVGP
jgi:PBP1b-binding outer membrane lipoprotein LpoB